VLVAIWRRPGRKEGGGSQVPTSPAQARSGALRFAGIGVGVEYVAQLLQHTVAVSGPAVGKAQGMAPGHARHGGWYLRR